MSLKTVCDALRTSMDLSLKSTMMHNLREKSEPSEFMAEGTVIKDLWNTVKQLRMSEKAADTPKSMHI